MKLIDNSPEYWEFIHRLRFHPDNVDGFVDSKPVTEKQQQEYMSKYGDCYKICLMDNKPVGFAGIVDGDIRIAVCPEYKKKGIGLFMLMGMADIMHTAKVLRKNKASLNLFLKAGYTVYEADEAFFYLTL